MAQRVAIASGNWSNPAIWNGGVLPQAGDVIASNNFTVTIDQNINVDSLTNTAQSIVGLVPNMTSSTTPSGIVTASISETGTYAAFNAFGGDFNTEWRPGAPAWIAYEFSTTKAVNQYFVQGYDGGAMTWTFEGWNGSAWVVLHSISAVYSSGYTSPLIGNSTAYIKYRLNFSSSPTRIHTIQFYEYLGTTAAVAGGTFTLGGGVTITCTGGGLIPGAVTLLTWNGGIGTVSNINSTYIRCISALGQSIVLSGLGTINIRSEIVGPTFSGAISTLYINQNGTINIVGNLSGGSSSGDTSRVVWVAAICTLNITGDLIGQYNQESNTLYIGAAATVKITGTVYGNTQGSNNKTIAIWAAVNLEITGNITSNNAAGLGTIVSGQAHYLKHVGSMIGGTATTGPCVTSTSASAINLFSGPFICSQYGTFPYLVVRMHLIPSTSNYFEFRDETTNGAVSPGAIAPATRLVSPATLVDNLAPANVRYGTTYALGTLTGTLRMPSANQVTYGVAVDNTFGNAVLTAASVWDYLVSSITVENSIGMRLKNVSTPQTIGEQLEAFLRLD